MILTTADSKVEIVPAREHGDVRLSVFVRTPSFRGTYGEVWVDQERLDAFLADLRRLEAERSGEAVLESWSPGEFHLAFRAVDGAGHIGAEVTLTRHELGSHRRHANRVGWDLEVPAEDLLRLIDDFEAELGVA